MVQDIEELGAELQGLAFGNLRVLCQIEIERVLARGSSNVAAGISKRSWRLQCEAGRIKPVQPALIGRDITPAMILGRDAAKLFPSPSRRSRRAR
jgi:hypothetical protein